MSRRISKATAQSSTVRTRWPGYLTSSDVLQLLAENEYLRRKVATLERALRSMADAWAREILPHAG